MYQFLVKPLLFSLDPENAHEVMKCISRVANVPFVSSLLTHLYSYNDPRFEAQVAGLSFKNPIGLAAGFDKNAELVGICAALGFGHLELGTVTGRAQPGNPQPRIFRLQGDRALINRMGFPSHGADGVCEQLSLIRGRFRSLPPLGINIGKSKEVDIEQAVDDYLYSFSKLSPLADYVAVNVSSPNTQGLRQLQDRERLSQILLALQKANTTKIPIFVKVAPDLTWSAMEEVIECCVEHSITGLIATNTTIMREGISTEISESGGLSGRPLKKRSLEVVQFLGSRVQGRLELIGVGGIDSSVDVLDHLAAGASLVQIYTGLIYQGPDLVHSILKDLSRFMDEVKAGSLSDAVLAWNEGSRKVA